MQPTVVASAPPPPAPTPDYLDVRLAAQYLSVTVWTIRRLIDSGLPFAKVGKRFIVKRTDLDAVWQRLSERAA